MLVVFLFLRRADADARRRAITVPLSLAGTFAADVALRLHASTTCRCMAITISVGFVVDDAIVMIENVHRNMEAGLRPRRGGARRRAADRLHGDRRSACR